VTLRLLDFSPQDDATATITPRSVQQFHPADGTVVNDAVSRPSDGVEVASGDVKVDEHGHVAIVGVPVSTAGRRLTLRI